MPVSPNPIASASPNTRRRWDCRAMSFAWDRATTIVSGGLALSAGRQRTRYRYDIAPSLAAVIGSFRHGLREIERRTVLLPEKVETGRGASGTAPMATSTS